MKSINFQDDIINTLIFDTLETPNGVLTGMEKQHEELTAKGVSGVLFRNTGGKHKPFNVVGRISYITYEEALTMQENLYNAKGCFTNLILDTKNYTNVFCKKCSSTIEQGRLMGDVVTEGNFILNVNLKMVVS